MSRRPLASKIFAPTLRLLSSMKGEAGVAVISISNLAATIILQLAIFRIVGASREADAYFAAAAIPQFIWAVAITSISGAVVPFLVKLKPAEQAAATRRLLLVLIAGAAVPGAILALSAEHWSRWLYVGFDDPATIALSARLSGLSILAIPAICAVAILTGLHQARGLFVRSEAIGTACSWLMVPAVIVALPTFGVEAAAVAVLIRYIVQAVALSLPLVGSERIHVELTPVWPRVRPLLVGNIYLKSEMFVDRYLLSMASPGSLSIVALAQSIYGPLTGVLAQSMATTALPRLSAEGGDISRSALFRRNLGLLGVSSTCLFVAAVLFAQPVLDFLTGGGTRAADGVQLWVVLLMLGGVPVFGAMGALVAVGFYSGGNTRIPTIVSALSYSVFVVVRVLAFWWIGPYGLCAAITCYYLCNFTVLILILRHRRIAI
jgi:putative peptidoglycan lipid II flippase